MSKVLGIDLGTTNSAMAIIQGGSPEVLTNADGARTTPSIVGFTRDGEILVGETAKRQMVTNPENTVFSVKRFIGRTYTEVAEERGRVPYHVVRGDNDSVLIEVPHTKKRYTPEQLSAFILQKFKQDAEAFLGEAVTQAVITVPAYFNDSQRQATKDAGQIAGLEVLRIVNEPTAASMAYGLDKKGERTLLVWDLGGGTFDVSILDIGDGVYEVKATNGDNHLGGDDWDARIVQWLVKRFQDASGVDVSKDRGALQRLRDAAEKAKIELSSRPKTTINLPFLAADASGPKHLEVDLTRAEFERMTGDLFQRTVQPTKQALADAGLTPADIDRVVLVGGSTRMPRVVQLIKELVGKDPDRGVNPDEAVALGAAIQSGVLTGDVKDLLLLDVTPLSLGIETLGGVSTRLIERNTTIPTKKTRVFSTAADNQTSVDVHVLQGERPMARDNKSLGRFLLDGIPPAPRGVPQVEVTFDIDANGILDVTAHDLGTGKRQNIRITGSTRLSEDEVERMQREAEQHADEDKRRLEKVETLNRAESLAHAAEKAVADAGDKVPGDVVKDVEAKVAELREALTKEDVGLVRSREEALAGAMSKIGEAVYRPAPSEPPAGTETETKTKKGVGDDAVDVDYEVSRD